MFYTSVWEDCMSKHKERESFEDAVVTVIKGKHKGKTGYCDSHFGREAVVYFGSWADGYFTVQPSSLTQADRKAERKYRSEFMSSPERFYRETNAAY